MSDEMEAAVDEKVKPALLEVKHKGNPSWKRNQRTIKMCAPSCKLCQFPYEPGWWNECPHEPYFTWKKKWIKVEENDDEHKTTFNTDNALKTKRPKWVQIAYGKKHFSGNGVRIARGRGAKTAIEVGYKPLCEYYNCFKPATNRYENGDYCSVNHARLVFADSHAIKLYAVEMGAGGQVNNANLKRQEQLEELNVRVLETIDA
jgi:hypothetical protein